jgi:NADH dehydrogenase FAD-containing subunit
MGCNASTDAHETSALSGTTIPYPHPNGKKTVVIIGAGLSGIAAGEGIWEHANVVFVDQKDHFEYNPFSLKMASEPQIVDTLFATYEEGMKAFNQGVQFVQGRVLNVLKDNTLEVEKGKSRIHIKYDYLVIAAGFTYNSPIKQENVFTVTERKAGLKKFADQVAAAKNILVCGGGIVGVELAGELAFNPKAAEKKITLAVRGDRLLN